ncbi:hypothetical protein PRIPAC_93314, partial [Pristionchus pacificus]
TSRFIYFVYEAIRMRFNKPPQGSRTGKK